MTIAAILQSKGAEVLTVRGDTPVREAVALLATRKIGAVPVVEVTLPPTVAVRLPVPVVSICKPSPVPRFKMSPVPE